MLAGDWVVVAPPAVDEDGLAAKHAVLGPRHVLCGALLHPVHVHPVLSGQTDRQVDKQVDKQADRQVDRQVDRQIDR